MTTSNRYDAVIAAWLADGPRELAADERSAIVAAAGLVRQRQPGFLGRPRSWGSVGAVGLAAVSIVIAASLLLSRWRDGPSVGGPSPSAPATTPSNSPPATASLFPGPSPIAIECVEDAPVVEAVWTGRIRTDAAAMPTLCMQADPEVFSGAPYRDDPVDAGYAGIDILHMGGYPSSWFFNNAGGLPAGDFADPALGVFEHGVAVDIDDDLVPDYLFGIDNRAPTLPHLRTWVTDLRTGTTVEQLGPPYGVPFDFIHPTNGATAEVSRGTWIYLFAQPSWWDSAPGPVVSSAPGTQRLSVSVIRFYGWATMTRDSVPLAWDYAPDFGWLSATPQQP